ncbi:MAG: YbjN domain-containing protein [Acidimicrobiia bacterium]|nr:YbjN domain-containing protein [Acidimicrobiia bacterium]
MIDDEGGTPRALSDAELDEVEARISDWAGRQLDELDIVDAVERGEVGQRRWFIRVLGESKDVFSIWLALRQRTLLYETYFIPAPEAGAASFYEYALRRNLELHGLAFAIGEEDAVYLRGHLPSEAVTDAELDRVLGSIYATVERCFRPMLRIGFASRFAPR